MIARILATPMVFFKKYLVKVLVFTAQFQMGMNMPNPPLIDVINFLHHEHIKDKKKYFYVNLRDI